MRRRGGAGQSRGRAALRAWNGSGSEHAHQAALVRWAALHAEHMPALRMLFAVPNGGLRAPATAGKLRAEGVRPGVPDLLLPVRTDAFIGLALEVKAPTRARQGLRACTAEQRWWLAMLAEQEWSAVVAFGVDAGRAALRWYLQAPAYEDDDVLFELGPGTGVWVVRSRETVRGGLRRRPA